MESRARTDFALARRLSIALFDQCRKTVESRGQCLCLFLLVVKKGSKDTGLALLSHAWPVSETEHDGVASGIDEAVSAEALNRDVGAL